MAESFSKKVTNAGRVTIPESIREKLDIEVGDRVKVKVERDEW